MPDSIAWAMDAQYWTIWLLMHDATILILAIIIIIIMMPDAQHWVIIILMPYGASIEALSNSEPYWWFSHSIELFWCLMLCCIELSSLNLNWACKMRLWAVHVRKLRKYDIDGGWQKLKTWFYLEKEGVLALIACLASVKIQQEVSETNSL